MAPTAVHDSSFTATRQARRISTASSGLVILLLAQYVLGIAYNLYGIAPTASKTIKPFSSPLLGAHVVLGTLLIVIAIYLVVASIRASMRIAVVASTIGLASLIAAWISGSAFTQKSASGYSMAMGVLTAVALLSYMSIVKASGFRDREASRTHAKNLAARERPAGPPVLGGTRASSVIARARRRAHQAHDRSGGDRADGTSSAPRPTRPSGEAGPP